MESDLERDDAEHIPPIQRLCRYLSERSPQPTIAVEGTTHLVTYLNPAFARLVGRDRNDLIGRPFAEAVPEGKANGALALLDRVFESGSPENLAEQAHRQEASRVVYWSYAVWPILGASSRPIGVLVQVTDSTEVAIFRQQAVALNEALLVASTRQHTLTEAAESLSARLQSAVSARDHFLAVLSHELRNPLAALNSALQMLKLDNSKPIRADGSRPLLDMMERQLNQMVRLVGDLLEVSRLSSGKLVLRRQQVELESVVRDAVEASRPLIDGGRHELTVALPREPILLDADPDRLAQVFMNLLNNAAKYSEPGGRIRLSAAREADGGEVVVRVRDTGIGIPAEHLPQVFEVFAQIDVEWRRAQGGMGIGLSLVKEFVTLHGGRVEAFSEGPGQGSEFVVHLPTVATAAEPTDASPVAVRGRRRRILVVDDNRDAADSMAMMLSMIGHEVHTVHDGDAAVSAATKFQPEIVLMDIGMPRVDGLEAARRIRAEPWGHAPYLVALTGWGADEDRRRSHAAGFDCHLVKPVAAEALLKLLAEPFATRS